MFRAISVLLSSFIICALIGASLGIFFYNFNSPLLAIAISRRFPAQKRNHYTQQNVAKNQQKQK